MLMMMMIPSLLRSAVTAFEYTCSMTESLKFHSSFEEFHGVIEH